MKLVIKESSSEVSAKKVRRPKFSHHRGRTWDSTKIKINDCEVAVWLDTTWGTRFYFKWNNRWYAISMTSLIDPWTVTEYTVKV